MASKSGDVTDEDDLDVDVDAETRLQAMALGMKQQADELLLANQLDKALTLYRELLMHLTRSQVTLLRQKELVVSCHMNALAALSKAKRWSSVVSEAAETFVVLAELKEAAELPLDDQQRENQVLARAFYFRGFAYMKLGTFQSAQQDFRQAMELNPEDEAIQNDYKELQTALLAEQKVKQCIATSMKFFQTGSYKSAVEACVSALRESQVLQKTELTGLIHGNLAAIYVKMKDDAKAIEHYKRTMLLTRCGGNPTAAQNERMFDILDSLAGCYSRKRDYSSALSVIEDQVKLFPLCPDRRDREAMMFLNAGRICDTMGRSPQAEEHLEKGYIAARKVSSQLDVALNCAYWLSKAYLKNNKAEKAMETLDATIPLAEEDSAGASTGELLEKLMMARLDLLDPELNTSAAEGSTFKGSLRETQLWQTLEYFEGKREICGHVRAAEVLVSFLQANGDHGEEGNSALMRALAQVDCVNIGKLSTSEATTFAKLALTKVDLMRGLSSTSQQEARALLVKLLRDLELPGGADPCCRQQLRAKILCRLVELFDGENEKDIDDDDRKLIENTVDVLRDSKAANDPAAKTKLAALLPLVGRWKAARGDIVGAEEVLKESVELLRGAADSNNDRLGEALIGLCVVQIRLGMVEEATKVMAEIESFPMIQNSNELMVVKGRLNSAAAAVALNEKHQKTERARKSSLFEKQQCTAEQSTFLCGISRVWWGRWCGPLIACVAAVALALMFA
ncbi:hypothetical protein PF005_g4978 [Phytophthora fragariae]|uniref:Uncharacterized protein n=5 Tax=Phytophthora fragariae TaxID=53985 RepID=A0A6A3LZ38_9STRA|nr:hypothetical protein PF003_g31860 [Phytophthora fragariae]KAE8944902.1 hypothetical protein PF009_g5437 [Phytophthora fragariae]KAE9023398.1 hypothetical protein PF011_g3994 [Phytophthora fragariae]KAE9128855.1 hypothetical protein PF010_g4350 [Phytophthora fragariae]KAE9129216.1 hypothetical protein PF007_g4999 [Phytophthora fragariae]